MASRGSPPGRRSVGSPAQEIIVELDADLAGAGVDDEIDPAAQIAEHMRGACRRNVAGAICRGRNDRSAEGGEQRARDRMRGHAHRDGVEPGQCKIGDLAIRLFGEHERQRSGPECGRQPFGGVGEDAGSARGVGAGDVRDQRIESRPPFGRIEARDGLTITGIGAQPVNGFSRERDQPAGRKAARRGLDRLVVGR